MVHYETIVPNQGESGVFLGGSIHLFHSNVLIVQSRFPTPETPFPQRCHWVDTILKSKPGNEWELGFQPPKPPSPKDTTEEWVGVMFGGIESEAGTRWQG